MRVGEIRVESEALVGANPVGNKSRVVIGECEARPVEEVRKLRSRLRGRTKRELRLNAIEDVPHALVGNVARKPAYHAGGAAREGWSAKPGASGQAGFEER